MRDGPAVCDTRLSFSGGHRSAGHTAIWDNPPEKPRSAVPAERHLPAAPFPQPPQRAPPVRDPLAGSTERRDAVVWCPHGQDSSSRRES